MTYEASLVAAVRRAPSLKPLLPVLRQLPRKLDAMLPGETVALLGVETNDDPLLQAVPIRASVLVFDGYDAAMSAQLMEDAKRTAGFPGWPSALLLSEAQLQSRLGPWLGRVMARAITCPEDEPILHALIQNEVAPPADSGPALRVTRTSSDYSLSAVLPVYGPLQYGPLRPVPDTEWEVVSRRRLTPHVALSHYYSVTGQRLNDQLMLCPTLSAYKRP